MLRVPYVGLGLWGLAVGYVLEMVLAWRVMSQSGFMCSTLQGDYLYVADRPASRVLLMFVDSGFSCCCCSRFQLVCALYLFVWAILGLYHCLLDLLAY